MITNPEIFRAYDIRGIVDRTLTEQTVYDIGRAMGTKVLALHGTQIVIGRDGRLSGQRLAQKLAAGILSTGCDVVDVGQVPTPCLYFASHELNINSAIMLTGSHNPPNYNGLKIILDGRTIYGASIQELYQIIIGQQFIEGAGQYQTADITAKYISTIVNNLTISKKLKIVVDCGNGVPGAVVPELFKKLNCTVIPLHCEVDGNFPNHHPDPSDPANLFDLIKAVKETQADIGLAFDGDGDRLGIIDSTGKIIWPDRLLMLFAQELLARKPGATIIYDVKCSRDVAEIITQAGGKALMWNTGHSLIKAKMHETGAQLAAEMSGHIFFKDRWFGFDDALYTGARLIEILAASSESAAQIFAKLPEMVSTPELSVDVEENNKFVIMQDLLLKCNFDAEHIKITIDGLRVEFKDGWGLVRPSNTTPKLVVRFEALNEVVLSQIKQQFRRELLLVAPQLSIPF
jgi:phosphomannomutase/phosphoglucomutase